MAITVTDEVKRIFTDTEEEAEVRSVDGHLLGRFIPARLLMTYPELGMSDVELDRLANEPETVWYTTDQVMARLREIDNA